jgi:hypothetical protein
MASNIVWAKIRREILKEFDLPRRFMDQNSSWSANRCSVRQEDSSILWDPKFHDRVHNSPLFPVLSQKDSVHILVIWFF